MKSINVFFTGNENMLVIKTSPFLVPVNKLLNISLFRLDAGSIVYFMIGTIVKRSYLGTLNPMVAEEQARDKLSVELTSPLQKGKLGPEILTCFSHISFSKSSFPKNPLRRGLQRASWISPG